MTIFLKISFILPLVLLSLCGNAQDSLKVYKVKTEPPLVVKKYHLFSYDPNKQVDLIDVGRGLLREGTQRLDTNAHEPWKLHVSAIPAVGYTLQTGFAALLSSNFAFYTSSRADENISSILTSITYSQYKQIIFPIQANIWSKNGKYNFQSDWRYLKYPSLTYGLGGGSSLNTGYTIDYSYLRLHQSVSRAITKDLYLGAGYDFDYFWNVKELDPDSGKVTDFQNYGLSKTSTSSGVSVSLLYDSRRNSINPENGSYLNVSYRPKFTFLGSDANWQSLLIEFRHYLKLSDNSNNVWAFWSYNWLTLNGNPPYLLLPSTGWDAYNNTGRGYIQGRFRSKNMLYAETEYRFGITPNGLFGGVIFANAESFSEKTSNKFEYIAPGYGLGVRIKLNKLSRANLCIDYGFGNGGSRGIAVNLGEVF